MPNSLRRFFFLAALLPGLAVLPLPASAPEPVEISVTAEHRQAAGLIVHLMSSYHYLRATLDDELSIDILDRYIDSMDPNRLIFLASDVDTFKANRHKFDDYLRAGYVKPAFDMFEVFRARVTERTELALALLEQGFDFERDERYEYRDEDSAWPRDVDELNELWRKRVKNDLLSLKLAGRTEEQARETLTKRYESIERRAKQLDSDDVFQLFINSYTMAVEPHTSYFSPRSSENFQIRMSLSLEGIGAALQTENEFTIVRRIIAGGPADLSGSLQLDDRIVGVGQGSDGEMVDVVTWRLEDVVDLIRGPKGTVVRLEILPKGRGPSGNREVITLVRNKIKLEDQAAQKRVIEIPGPHGGTKIGVINVPTFYLDMTALANGEENYRSTTRDVRRLIAELETEGVSGIVIDLRGNGGGSLVEATELTGLFIRSGPVVQVRDSTGRVKVNDDPDPGVAYEGPVAVLVDRQSASASEIFAGAMQDYGRAIVIGEPTYGKGTVQNVVDLNRFVTSKAGNLGQLKVTIAQFFRVNGASTQHRGVVPDIVFPTAYDTHTEGERALKNALPWDTIKATAFLPQGQIDGTTVAAAKAHHERRVEADPGFRYLLAETRARDELDELESVTLLESARKAELDARERESETRLNAFRASRGLKPIGEDPEAEAGENEIDVLLEEAAHILSDIVSSNPGLALLRPSPKSTTTAAER